MIGCLVKWIHDLEPTNLCVVLAKITDPDEHPEFGSADIDDLYLLYDMSCLL